LRLEIGNTKNGEIAIIANNVLMKIRARVGGARARQCAVFGIVGRNTASSPIAGRNAQTW
jgi:hypothetical protein